MALVQSSTTPITHTQAPEIVLSRAIEDFQGALSDSQRNELQKSNQVPDEGDVITFTSTLDLTASSKGRTVATRLHTFLESVSGYATIVDSYVSSNPEIAALVWGTVKFAMTFASNYTSYFEQFSALFVRLTRHYPRFSEYRALYPASDRLKVALANFYAAVVRSCKHLIVVIQRSFFEQALNALYQSFTQEFKADIDEIERYGNDVKEELELAKAKIDREEQSLQHAHRAEQSGMKHKLKGYFSDTRNRLDAIKEMQIQQDEYRSRQHDQLLLDRISSHNYLGPYKEACRKRLRGTSQWIFSTPEFSRWREADTSSLLLCSGKIGSGKTIVSSSAIAHVLATRKTPDECVTFFFIRHDDPESQKAEVVLRSILRQSLHLNSLHVGGMMDTLEELDANICPSRGDLEAILEQRINLTKSFYVFIDGLNECEPLERRDLLDSLASLTRNPAMKLFLAAQESLDTELRKVFPLSKHVSMASGAASSDTSLIINEMLHERRERGDLVIGDPSLFDIIQEALTARVDGMIMWACFLIDDICTCRRDDEIRQALCNLPRDLEDTFMRTLKRIKPRRKVELVQRIFLWVAVAKRSLTIGELREAISLEVGQPHIESGKLVNGIESIVAWCENMVQLDEELETVRFAHSTIYDFITKTEHAELDQLTNFFIDVEDANHHAGEICTTYLSLSNFTTTVARKPKPVPIPSPVMIAANTLDNYGKLARLKKYVIKDQVAPLEMPREQLAGYERASDAMAINLEKSYPFLGYVKLHWWSHTTRFDEQRSATWRQWRSIVTEGHALAEIPWPAHDPSKYPDQELLTWVSSVRHCAILHVWVQLGVVSVHGLPKMLTRSSEKGDLYMVEFLLVEMKPEQVDATYYHNPHYEVNALVAASSHGHLAIVDRLLAAGADVNILDGQALLSAAQSGHAEVVDRLLVAGADVDAGRLAFQQAAKCGDLPVVERLLATGVVDCNGAETLTQKALEMGFSDIADCLREAKARANDGRIDLGRTPLCLASEGGHFNVVRRLLKVGANVDMMETPGETALKVASKNGHLDIVDRLLEAGADVNAMESWGETALNVASTSGHLAIVNRLLDAGADVHGSKGWYETPLQVASMNGHLGIVDILLKAGADVHGRKGWYETPLQVASMNGHLETVDSLLRAGADVHTATRFGATAIHSASRAGHLEIVNKLLAAGAHVDKQAIEAASVNGYTAVVKRLETAQSTYLWYGQKRAEGPGP